MSNLSLSKCKEIKSACSELHSEPCFREVLTYIVDEDPDFEVDNVRFIRKDSIDHIQCDELESDLYILGCFNASFLSKVLNIDLDVIVAMQEAEAFEALGKLIVSLEKVEDVQRSYAAIDGYGHHFNGYDFSEVEIHNYIVFDNR